jgi:hypothetical protein
MEIRIDSSGTESDPGSDKSTRVHCTRNQTMLLPPIKWLERDFNHVTQMGGEIYKSSCLVQGRKANLATIET